MLQKCFCDHNGHLAKQPITGKIILLFVGDFIADYRSGNIRAVLWLVELKFVESVGQDLVSH